MAAKSKSKRVAKPKVKPEPERVLNCQNCGGTGLSDYALKGDGASQICRVCRGTGRV